MSATPSTRREKVVETLDAAEPIWAAWLPRPRAVHLSALSTHPRLPTGPRCRSLSGLAIEPMDLIWPSATLRPTTPTRRCWLSKMRVPGPPLISVGRKVRLGRRESRLSHSIRVLGDAGAAAQGLGERRGLAAAVAGQLDVVGEQGLEAGEVALFGGLEEAAGQLLALLAGRLEAGAALLDVAPGAGRELAHVVLALADDRGDLGVAVVEDVVEQEDRALLGREALEQDQHRQRERVGGLGVAGRVVLAVGDDRLRQPFADVALAAGAGGAQLVDRQAGGDGGDEGARRLDPLAGVERLMHAQQRLLHHVLGFGDAAEHAVGDRERDRAQLVQQSLAIGHTHRTTQRLVL